MSPFFLNTYALNDELNQIASWFGVNKLCLSSSKTQMINISSLSLVVTLSGKTLHQIECVKYLCVLPDREFKYDCHIKKVVKKISHQFFFLSD